MRKQEYEDGWIRTFRCGEIPSFDENIRKMLHDWIFGDNIGRAMIFLTHPDYGVCLDEDLCDFVIREFLRGNM